jgi:hypothetical protein
VGGASAGPAGTGAPSPGDRFRVDVR